MMDVKTFLKPVSGNHSIKEAVITIFLAAPIIKPERFEVLIRENFKDKFQKFEKLNQIQFRVRGKVGGSIESPTSEIHENVGFRFQRFEDGKIVSALQGMNDEARNFISFHSLNYSDWDIFFPDFKNVMTEVSIFHPNLFVNALSLHYIDEFIWDSNSDIETKLIFNERSSLLPKEFFSCRLDNYQFTTVKKKKFEYFDRLEIKIDERPKKFIKISHNIILNMNDNIALNELMLSDELKEMLDHAHQLNKETLFNILTKDVCDLINMQNESNN